MQMNCNWRVLFYLPKGERVMSDKERKIMIVTAVVAFVLIVGGVLQIIGI